MAASQQRTETPSYMKLTIRCTTEEREEWSAKAIEMGYDSLSDAVRYNLDNLKRKPRNV